MPTSPLTTGETPRQKASVGKTIGIGCGVVFIGVIALIIILIIIGVIVGESVEDETSTTLTRSPATTPRTAASCPTEAEQAYFDELVSNVVVASTLMTMYGEEFIAASETPLVVFDEDWKFAREADFMTLDVYFDNLIALEAPASAAQIDRRLEEIAYDAKEALRNIDRGIQDFDMDRLNLGTIQLEEITPKWVALSHDRETFCE